MPQSSLCKLDFKGIQCVRSGGGVEKRRRKGGRGEKKGGGSTGGAEALIKLSAKNSKLGKEGDA